MTMLFIAKLTVFFILIILIHELGHLLVAKLFKFKVNEFAVGLGKTLYSKKYGDTNYMIKAIPIGGHINLEVKDFKEWSSGKTAKWMLGVAAGPAANVITGLLLYRVSPWFGLLSIATGLQQLIPFPPLDGFLLVAGTYHLTQKLKAGK